MNLYEVVFIARHDLTVDDVDNLSDKLLNIILERGGKLASKEYWGLRNLSYKINKNSRGHYVLLNIESDFESISEMKRVMGFNENIIRSSIFRVNEHLKESPLIISVNAKDYKAGKATAPKSNQNDSIIDQIIINS